MDAKVPDLSPEDVRPVNKPSKEAIKYLTGSLVDFLSE